MAGKMVNCKTCGAVIAKNAKACPYCGAKRKRKKLWLILLILFVVVVFFVIVGSGGSSSKEKTKPLDEQGNELSETDFKAACESIAFKDIARNPDSYNGRYLKFRGKVIQVQENSNSESIYRVDVTEDEYGYWDDTIYVTYLLSENESKILEDDIVTLYGICQGSTSYTSVLGEKITLPAVEALYVDIEE